MKTKKTKAEKPSAAVADIPAEVTLADILKEIRRGFADVVYAIGKADKSVGNVETAQREGLERLRRIMFYIPDVKAGVEEAKAKKAHAEKAKETVEIENTIKE